MRKGFGAMKCTVRVLREIKKISGAGGNKVERAILIYCPLLGEVGFKGKKAEEILEKISRREGEEKQ